MPLKSSLSPVDIPEMAFHKKIWEMIKANGDRTAIIDATTDRRLTYPQLLMNIRAVASGLRKMGLKTGDIVAMFSPNSPEWIFMFFAVIANGATVTTLNPKYTSYELTHNITDSRPRYVFTVAPLKKLVAESAKRSGGFVEKLIIHGPRDENGSGCINFDDLVNDDGSAFPDDVVINARDDVAVIPYSSGTTGLPKGVMITHYNLIAAQAIQSHPRLQDPRAKQPGAKPPVIISFLPFFHVYGMIATMIGAIRRGGTLVIQQRFDVKQFLEACEKYKVTDLPLVPPVVVALNNTDLIDKYDLSSVVRAHSGAAPLTKDTEETFAKKLKVGTVRQAFGMTETTCHGFKHIPTAPIRLGSSGMLYSNTEIKIIDVETGRELGPGERGELLYRGPNVMKGYLNRPEATANTIDKDGWLHTGDIAYYDKDGYTYIVDRLKELIKYKGFQVAPAELEGLLLEHPKVADAAVIGIPNKEAGELPRAYVVKAKDADVTEEELKQYVAERLSTYKHLKGGVRFMERIPKSDSGKILRRQLKDMASKSKL